MPEPIVSYRRSVSDEPEIASMREWNAETYHRVSNPQFDWGAVVLDRLPLRGDELVLDVGCGTGRLTEKLLDRLPRGRVLAIDLSANMLQVARDYLRPSFGARIELALADAAALPVCERADAIFSTATFHWTLDHPVLFRSLHRALKPGGCLVAQCGGGAKLARIHHRLDVLKHTPEFARYFNAWRTPGNLPMPRRRDIVSRKPASRTSAPASNRRRSCFGTPSRLRSSSPT